MDHLPAHPVSYRPITIPLLCPLDAVFEPCPGLDFDFYKTYEPPAALWSFRRPLTADEAALAQAWAPKLQGFMYFSLLATILDRTISVADFATESSDTSSDSRTEGWLKSSNAANSAPPAAQIITTRKLRPLLKRWLTGYQNPKGVPTWIASQRRACLRIIDHVGEVFSRFEEPAAAFGSEEVAFGVQVLVTTLVNVLIRVSYCATWQKFKTSIRLRDFPNTDRVLQSSWLDASMVADGWCPSMMKMFGHTSNLILQYYTALFGPPLLRSHRNCREYGCASLTISRDSYRTAHVDDDCKCDYLGPPAGSLESILTHCGVPVLSLQYSDGEAELVVENHRPGIEYTAISHVWSDGLGNPVDNSLPQCQLEQLAKRCQRLKWTQARKDENLETRDDTTWSTEDVKNGQTWRRDGLYSTSGLNDMPCWFWIDTICVPRNNAALQAQAIMSMREVYKQVCIPSSSPSPIFLPR